MLVGDKDYCHKEADMYFVDSNGNYKFEPSKIKDDINGVKMRLSLL